MSIYDSELDQSTIFDSLGEKYDQYDYYFRGEQIRYVSRDELRNQIEKCCDLGMVVMKRRNEGRV